MQLKDFDYTLPAHMIAQYPLKQRDAARLMIINRAQKTITHDRFNRIENYLDPQSLFVLNDSKVIAARLIGQKEDGNKPVEVFLLKKLSDGYCYEALLKPLRRIKDNEKIFFNGQKLYAVLENREKKIVRFNQKNIIGHLSRIGHIPLPPYIKRSDEPLDRQSYQTVYARHQGSVAAPTAGLHFTKPLLKRLQGSGHQFAKVTLHINYGTFHPVKEEDISKHQMHQEEYLVSPSAWRSIQTAKARGKKIVSVGTTSCRVLEATARTNQFKGSTDLFIYPGFSFRMVDCLLTNFHLPKSTLLMLVCAFAGTDLVMKAYRQAVKEKYRFYSYGDCMLIL